MSRKLFEITEDLVKLNDLLDEVEGDMSRIGEMEAAVSAWMDGLAFEESSKLDAYVNLIKTLEMEAATAKAEAEQFAKKAKSREARVAWLKSSLQKHMEMTGRTKAETASGRTIAIQGNGGKKPIVMSPDFRPEDAAGRFQKHRVEFDMEAIREHLEAGNSLIYASLMERGKTLRIR